MLFKCFKKNHAKLIQVDLYQMHISDLINFWLSNNTVSLSFLVTDELLVSEGGF